MSDTLRQLVKNNPETIDFVRDYQEKKDLPPAEDIGEVTPGVIPHLLQWDERWGYQIYGDNLIAVNGCGPTVISMVAAGLTGDNTITPYKAAKFAEQNGYYEGDAGTSWALMTEGAEQFGIHGERQSFPPWKTAVPSYAAWVTGILLPQATLSYLSGSKTGRSVSTTRTV